MSGPGPGYQYAGGQLAGVKAHIGGPTTSTQQHVGGATSSGSSTFSMSGGQPPNEKGRVGRFHQIRYQAAGNPATVTYSVASGALPTGMTLDTVQGLVSGTLTAAGTFNWTIGGTCTGGTAVSIAQQMVVQP